MRFINYIFRFIVFTIAILIFSLIIYVGTIIAMIFINWDREYESIKTIHTEMYKSWKELIWG
jgi:hypothetical protein